MQFALWGYQGRVKSSLHIPNAQKNLMNQFSSLSFQSSQMVTTLQEIPAHLLDEALLADDDAEWRHSEDGGRLL